MEDDAVWARFKRPLPQPIMTPNDVKKQCGGAGILKKTIDNRKQLEQISNPLF